MALDSGSTSLRDDDIEVAVAEAYADGWWMFLVAGILWLLLGFVILVRTAYEGGGAYFESSAATLRNNVVASNMAGLSSDDVTTILGKRAILHIPTAGPELTQAINQGRPLALHQPKSPVGRALHTVADQVRTRIDDRAVRR